jgi:cyclophilin family peptidyl-prolyl cis-trans isomerase
VELFDHDKPATVQNFIHYITSGAYSNTFFDRDVTNFVLQAGYYVTTDRSTNYINGGAVSTGTNIFPAQVDSEFNVGPLIHNTFGTLAMALQSGNSNSATSAFFLNLADNSTNLDNQNGGFTVFGRILSGTNILQYFNTLSAPSNGIFDLNSSIPTLPVNDDGTNNPENANLFFCDFAFVTAPPVDISPPSVSLVFPTPNEALTNVSPLTVQGTASDNVGVAEVFCVLTPLPASAAGASQTNAALGTTNWSLDLGALSAGIYQLTAFAQDGAGNLSPPTSIYFTNLAQLTLITNRDGQLTTNLEYLVPGRQYSVSAVPVAGQEFYGWTSNGVTSLDPVQTFTLHSNLTLTVSYFTSDATAAVTIVSPVAGKQALSIQSVLQVTGTVASTNVRQLTCQFFVNSNSVSSAQIATLTGTNWSLQVTNLANGAYTLSAVATDAAGGGSSALVKFTLLNVETLTIHIVGKGTVLSNPGTYVVPGAYALKAVPASGHAFYDWNDGVTTTLNPARTFQIRSNLTVTATFVPQSAALAEMAFTYPAANANLTNATFNVTGRLPASLVLTQLTCQLFLQSNGVTELPQLATIASDSVRWSFAVSNLAPGPYTILAVGYDNQGAARLVSEKFNLLARMSLAAQPSGAGAVAAGLNGKYLTVGQTYSVSASPKTGHLFTFWTGPVANSNVSATTFVMSSNTALTANFTSNLFPTVAGSYTGLFFDPSNVSPTNAGSVAITTTGTGSFSGQMKFASRTYQLAWAFPYDGAVFLHGTGLDGNLLELSLNLDLTNGTDTITGYVADQPSASTYNWVSGLVLHRAVTRLTGSNAPEAGKYVTLLQPGNASGAGAATGYAAISLGTTGSVALTGAMPDSTSISQSASLSQDGIWPVFIVPGSYRSLGLVIGWQTNSPSGGCDGQLFWVAPHQASATSLNSIGSMFSAPAAGTQYQIVLPGGATNSLTVGAARGFLPQPPVIGISSLPNGVLTGVVSVNHHDLSFKGAFVSPAAGGGGFVLQTNGQTEGFQILPQP